MAMDKGGGLSQGGFLCVGHGGAGAGIVVSGVGRHMSSEKSLSLQAQPQSTPYSGTGN